jgi:hypothetical protein
MNQTKKQKEILKLSENLTYIDIERNKIRDKVKLMENDSEVDFSVVKDINYWIGKDLRAIKSTLEYINEII